MIWRYVDQSRFSRKAGKILKRLEPGVHQILANPEANFASRWSLFTEAVKWRRFASLAKFVPRFRGRRTSNRETRSVVFLHHCYYNFYYLAKALRRRGWDAISVCVDGPDHNSIAFAHGSDLTIYDADRTKWLKKIDEFVSGVPDRFAMVHFYGLGRMSWFPVWWDRDGNHSAIPLDFLYLKRRGLKIGYTTCGCLDGVSPESFYEWSSGCCDKCIWQSRPDICSRSKNLAWGEKVNRIVDVYATEGLARLDYQGTEKCYSEPLTQALDPEFWQPDLTIPEKWKIDRQPGEILVYHGVGNYGLRTEDGQNIKGTGAIISAVERLKSEGIPIRLIFAKDVHSKEVRFLQAQADIVIDQLNFGRYGSTTREALMLGKPTICRICAVELPGQKQLESLEDCPIVSADETSIYDVLRELVLDEARRARIGRESRVYAMKWFDMDACAERFERVYDRIMAGQPLSP